MTKATESVSYERGMCRRLGVTTNYGAVVSYLVRMIRAQDPGGGRNLYTKAAAKNLGWVKGEAPIQCLGRNEKKSAAVTAVNNNKK